MNREVALKEIKERSADQLHSQAKFLLEAEVTGGLEHPGIVPVYALGHHDDGRPYYAMRFIRGKSLHDAIRRFHADESLKADPGIRLLAFQKLLRRFTDVCNAIGYAHSRGILHRDLKPDNVMVGKYGETLVVDWGLAKAIGHSGEAGKTFHDPEDPLPEASLEPISADGLAATQAGSLVGTPAYMSPEQASGRLDLLGPASDIYGLGATLYHLICNRPPVSGTSLGEVLAKVQSGDCPRPRTLVPLARPRARSRLSEGDGVEAAGPLRPHLGPSPMTSIAGSRASPSPPTRNPGLAGPVAGRRTIGRPWPPPSRPRPLPPCCSASSPGPGPCNARGPTPRQAPLCSTARPWRTRPGPRGPWSAGRRRSSRSSAPKTGSNLVAGARASAGRSPPGSRPSVASNRDSERPLTPGSGIVGPSTRWSRPEAEGRSSRKVTSISLRLSVDIWAAFRAHDIDVEKLPVKESARRIRSSPIVDQLIAALDDWAHIRGCNVPPDRLEAIAKAADTDSKRSAIRDAASRNDMAALRSLCDSDEAVRGLGPRFRLAFDSIRRLDAGSNFPILEAIRREHSDDFWLNFNLGIACQYARPPRGVEAVRWLSAAVALRPESQAALLNLGRALRDLGRSEEAIATFREATRIYPDDVWAHNNLGEALNARKKPDLAAAEFREAIRLKPDHAGSHENLAATLRDLGKPDEAIAEYREAIRITPSSLILTSTSPTS